MIPIRRNSTAHLALLYLKMKNNWISTKHLLKLSPSKYEYEYLAKRALDKLVHNGFAVSKQNMYHITQQGINACFAIPREQKRIAHED